MSDTELLKIASVIADSLFTNGAHQEASRLLLVREGAIYASVVNGTYLGGLSKRATTDRIVGILKEMTKQQTTHP